MPRSFLLEIVTPEKRFYSGEVEIVIARTHSGDEGFMAGHIWACKLLDTDELWFREAGEKDYRLAAISGGYIDVSGNVMIFTDTAEWPDEIDVERAETARRLEQGWLDEHKEKDMPDLATEIALHKLAMRRAIVRKKVAAGGGRKRH